MDISFRRQVMDMPNDTNDTVVITPLQARCSDVCCDAQCTPLSDKATAKPTVRHRSDFLLPPRNSAPLPLPPDVVKGEPRKCADTDRQFHYLYNLHDVQIPDAHHIRRPTIVRWTPVLYTPSVPYLIPSTLMSGDPARHLSAGPCPQCGWKILGYNAS